MKYRIVLTLKINLYLSKDKLIEIFNLSWMNWDQVRHGISTVLPDDDQTASSEAVWSGSSLCFCVHADLAGH